MNNKILEKLQNPFLLSIILLLLTLFITIQNFLNVPSIVGAPNTEMTSYGNYQIFKNSFLHLINHKNLYQYFKNEHTDLYKYSPTFALLMFPMALLPDLLGLFVWNLLNIFLLFAAIWKFPFPKQNLKLWACFFILLEAITSLTNSQSNCIMAALILCAFLLLENKNTALASLLLVLTVYIKLFGIIAFVIFLFYPNKVKAILYSLLWAILLFLLPVLVIPFTELLQQYKDWSYLLANDYSVSNGFSVMGWLSTWFSFSFSKGLVVGVGFLIFCMPLLRFKQYSNFFFRLCFLSSTLIWVVIFNHKAESPTFVIAVSGIAIWFFFQKFNALNLALLILTIIFTLLSTTDLFPYSIRDKYFYPYVVKVVPCIFIWVKIIYDLLSTEIELTETSNAKNIDLNVT